MTRLRYDSKQVAKVTVHVPPGDVVEVSAAVAAQLTVDPHWRVEDAPAPAAAGVAADGPAEVGPDADTAPNKRRKSASRKAAGGEA